jgi:hypothetical protein
MNEADKACYAGDVVLVQTLFIGAVTSNREAEWRRIIQAIDLARGG